MRLVRISIRKPPEQRLGIPVFTVLGILKILVLRWVGGNCEPLSYAGWGGTRLCELVFCGLPILWWTYTGNVYRGWQNTQIGTTCRVNSVTFGAVYPSHVL